MPYTPTRDPFSVNVGKFEKPVDTSDVAADIVPHDSNDLLVYARALYVGGAGNVVLLPAKNLDVAPVTFMNVQAGSYILVNTRRVLATGTTATNIVALL